MVQMKFCVCVCERERERVCVYIYICYECTYTPKHIMDPCLRQQETNMITNSCITHHIETLWWKLPQPNNHHQFMPCQYFPFTYMQPFSHSFSVQTVCACYMHSSCLLVWVLIMLCDDDLIHLFVEDEMLQCKLHNINVTCLLTEFTFTQMVKL
jgi:hypothetical protein